MKKHTTRSTGRTRNATSAGKKDIHRPIAKIKRDKDNDDKITKTTSSRESTKKLKNDTKKMSRVFNIVNTQLQRLKEAESDLSDSED